MQTSHADSVYMPLCLSAVFPFHYMQLPQSFQTRSTTSLCYRLKRNSESSLLPWVDVTRDNPVLSSSAASVLPLSRAVHSVFEKGVGNLHAQLCPSLKVKALARSGRVFFSTRPNSQICMAVHVSLRWKVIFHFCTSHAMHLTVPKPSRVECIST